jgi:hypothetical protein
MTRRNLLIAIVLVTLMGAKGAARTSWAQKASVPQHQDTVALGHDQAIELLLVMDTGKNGKVSNKHGWSSWKLSLTDSIRTKRGNSTLDSSGNRSASEALPGDEEQLPRQNA